MAAFPDVTLSQEFVAQTEYKSDTVKVLQLEDNTEGKSLRAFVQLGDNTSFKYWITVASGEEEYSVDWSNADVSAAIQAFFTAQAAE